jgi:hypothetical protein
LNKKFNRNKDKIEWRDMESYVSLVVKLCEAKVAKIHDELASLEGFHNRLTLGEAHANSNKLSRTSSNISAQSQFSTNLE